MFRDRFLVTIILGPLGLFLVYLGGWFYFLPIAAILVLAAVEYSRLTQKLNWRVPIRLLLPIVVALWLTTIPELVGLDVNATAYIPHLLLIGMVATLVYALWLYEKQPAEKALSSWAALVLGIMLLGWLGSHFFRLRAMGDMAVQWTAIALLASWSADGAAFLVGRSIGRHKLAPRLSPKKTVEGYIGGIVFGTLITAIAATILGMDTIPVIILSFVISTITPAGDLGISLLKREADVKDSGQFLPGHGGALDRVDTVLWSVTIAFYLIPLLT
ncbi:MAG: phosphatidate cytidylyltransferase [Candidatus Promineifilaceae bacterium]